MHGKQHLLTFFFISSIYFLNDFLFIAFKSWESWLVVDYSTRFLSLAILFYLIYKKTLDKEVLLLKKTAVTETIFYSIAITFAGTAVIHIIDTKLYSFFEFSHLMKFPKIENPFFNFFDLYIGLIFVAVSEEFIFRSYFYSLFRDKIGMKMMIFCSSLFFALIHWGSGIDAMLGAFLWGAMAMYVLIRTKSVVPGIIAHYFTNLILFSDILE